MAKQIKILCPFCGLHPRGMDLERIAKEVAEIRVFLVEFGGKVKSSSAGEYQKKGRGKSPGLLTWTEIKEAPIPKKIVAHFLERIKKFEKIYDK